LGKDVSFFHIDVGDGKFINRTFSAIDKVEYLRMKYPKVKLHAHLMVENPHHSKKGEDSIIEQYAKAGCDTIGIHRKSIMPLNELNIVIKTIHDYGVSAGLVLEISEFADAALWKYIVENNIHWLIIMGVEVGYGGQIFNTKILHKIATLNKFAIDENWDLLIEVDGGLTLENIKLCRDVGAQIFAGWSIVKGKTSEASAENVHEVIKQINGNYAGRNTNGE